MLVAHNTNLSTIFIPATGWQDATGVTFARGYGEMRGRNGNVTATPAVQTTNDVHDPGGSSTTPVGSTISTDGVSDPNGANAVSTGSARFIRGGWLVTLSSTTNLATAAVAGVIELIRN
jgi:hypothetical protein